jgi:isoleucyl-tRNA synthetase
MKASEAGEDELRQKNEIVTREEGILKFWQEREIFKKTLEKPAPKGEFIFYEGPPTANGRPGIHHLESRAFKDAIPRYRTMRGFHVRRKAGWDTHGLPVELEVEKELGIKNKKDIEAYGVAKFNQKCKESVLRYIDEWKKFTDRIAFWVEHESTYFTFDNTYIESVWNILKRAHERKLLYKDYKVVPWCPRCGTALSSHEVAQGYDEVKDPSIYVKFKIGNAEEFLLAWTTTPWTLPGNVALAVHPEVVYCKVKINSEVLWVAQERLFAVAPEAEVLEKKLGKELVGVHYEPLYPFIKDNGKAYRVYAADFVSTKDGTGTVHTAVMYGADDFELGTNVGLPKQHLVGEDGVFLPEAGQFKGLFVKKADALIIDDLQNRGLLFKKEEIIHTYPFCWRCKTPLLYYADTSWYIRMSELKGELAAQNDTIHWVPEHIQHGRFGEWLRELKDWAISRARFWGTPLPIWECETCKKFTVIGSMQELKEKSGTLPSDLHRPTIDEPNFPCECGGTMRRVPEVLDVWFDSGAMPFAQDHYPFENKRWVEGAGYPADFICEAIDQTRGWFYTLHAIGGIMERGKAYKNVICLGHVLDAKGKKMSKSLGNIVEPNAVIEKYGVDAVRYFMYTVNAPGESKNFDERAVDEIVKKNFGRLANVLAFYQLYAEAPPATLEGTRDSAPGVSASVLDTWILSRLSQLTQVITVGFEAYELDAATRPITQFIDDLSAWYVRRSRERFKHEGAGREAARKTLQNVLRTLACLMAPTTPFFAEYLFQAVRTAEDPESVHLAQWPEAGVVDEKLIEEMAHARGVVSQALKQRETAALKIRQPLSKLTVQSLARSLTAIVADEVNVKAVVIDAASTDEVVLDTTLTRELQEEGAVRNMMRKIQEWRKEKKLNINDRPHYLLRATKEETAIAQKYRENIIAETGLGELTIEEV